MAGEQLKALTAIYRLDLTFGNPEPVQGLAASVAEVLSSPHPISRVTGQVRSVVLVMDYGTLLGCRRVGASGKGKVRRIRRFPRNGDIPSRDEIRRRPTVGRPDTYDIQRRDGEVARASCAAIAAGETRIDTRDVDEPISNPEVLHCAATAQTSDNGPTVRSVSERVEDDVRPVEGGRR